MTPAQREILRAIVAHRAQHAVSPTLRELANTLPTAKSTIQDRANYLIANGYLDRQPNTNRSLIPTPKAIAAILGPPPEADVVALADLIERHRNNQLPSLDLANQLAGIIHEAVQHALGRDIE